MKTIRNWEDLKPYGINCLTGEACVINARALVDLTPVGCALVREFLGLSTASPDQAVFNGPWNNSPAIASMFLPWDILPSLSAFLLIKSGCPCAIHVAQDGIYGIEPNDSRDLVDQWIAGQDVARQWGILPNHPRVGLSAVHAMSGAAQG